MTGALIEARDSSRNIPQPRPGERLIGIPIGQRNMVDVPCTIFYPITLPIPTRMFGVDFRRSTNAKTHETMFIGAALPEHDEDPVAARISSVGPRAHNRSIAFLRQETLTGRGITRDDVIEIEINGTRRIYSALLTKGADIRNPYLQNDSHYPFNLRVSRLVDARMTASSVKKLKWIQDNIPEINTEVLIGVSRPDELPVSIRRVIPGSYPTAYTSEIGYVSQDRYKELLLEKAQEINDSGAYIKIDLEGKKIDIDKAKNFLKDVVFVIENRVHTVPFRFSDLMLPFTMKDKYTTRRGAREDFVVMMNYMISYQNLSRDENNQLQMLQMPQDDHDFLTAIENNRATFRFFYHAANNLGRQVGLLHRHGLAHNGLHEGNILGDGNFCDPDSIVGTPLGSEPAEWYIPADAYRAMRSLYLLTATLKSAGLITKDQLVEIGRQFGQQYMHTRGENQPFHDDIFRKELMLLVHQDSPITKDRTRMERFDNYKSWVEKVLSA